MRATLKFIKRPGDPYILRVMSLKQIDLETGDVTEKSYHLGNLQRGSGRWYFIINTRVRSGLGLSVLRQLRNRIAKLERKERDASGN